VIDSRDPALLTPECRELALQLIDNLARAGIKAIITSTLRDFEKQDALYAQGRTTPGHIVTNAKAGDSFHNYGVAFDIVPIIEGRAFYDTQSISARALWQKIGVAGKALGLEWGGDWSSLKDFPHFQLSGLSLATLKLKAHFT
jgi:peptidoglycan L-alanyl-D-glutamate endopeptidase CwlK